MPDEVVFNVREVMRELNNLDPQLTKDLRKEAKGVASGMQKAIKRKINTIQPLSGMRPENNPTGRLAWGAGKKADTVVIRFRASRSRTRAVTPLVSLWITSPMTAVADTAGKGNFRRSQSITREYDYKGAKRRHRVNPRQGEQFVSALKSRDANNFVYGQVEAEIPMAEREIKLIFEKYARKVNRRIG